MNIGDHATIGVPYIFLLQTAKLKALSTYQWVMSVWSYIQRQLFVYCRVCAFQLTLPVKPVAHEHRPGEPNVLVGQSAMSIVQITFCSVSDLMLCACKITLRT